MTQHEFCSVTTLVLNIPPPPYLSPVATLVLNIATNLSPAFIIFIELRKIYATDHYNILTCSYYWFNEVIYKISIFLIFCTFCHVIDFKYHILIS